MLWTNEAARTLLEATPDRLASVLDKEEADALAVAGDCGQPVRLVVRVGRHPEAPTLLAAVQPVGDGRSLVTLTAADTDAALSGLPGRATFVRRLERTVQRALADERLLYAVLLVEIDELALSGDSSGRAGAEALLPAVGRRLQGCVRPGDAVGHLEAGRFAILVERLASGESALALATRVQASLLAPFRVPAGEVFARAAAGMALSTSGYALAEDVLRDAGIALARAKEHGAGGLEVFDTAMRERAQSRLRLEAELRRGLEHGEFVLHYQPIVDAATGAPYGFEALLRWQHPLRGLVMPAQFIRVAEDTGLIVPIADGVFPEACEAVRAWRERRPALSLSMNFTATHFHDASVVDSVLRALERSGLPPQALVVEITETALVTDFATVAAALGELRDHGVRVHLDDFGTGYSSLSYLHNLPIDAIKIDRSFVSRLETAPSAAALVKAVLDLAASLGKRVIAEGVENEAQAARLRALGCPLLQGFLFSPALPRADAGRWLERARQG